MNRDDLTHDVGLGRGEKEGRESEEANLLGDAGSKDPRTLEAIVWA
jgi:hypothetical protein